MYATISNQSAFVGGRRLWHFQFNWRFREIFATNRSVDNRHRNRMNSTI